MRLPRIFAVVLVALLSIGAEAQPLWQQSSVGMSPEEVLAAFPGSVAVPQGKPGHFGETEQVKLEGVEIAGCSFRVGFAFVQNKLYMVRLACDSGATPNGDVVASAVLDGLRAKYGPELSRTVNSRSMTQTNWSAGGTSINLTVLRITGTSVYIAYSTTIGKDANKL